MLILDRKNGDELIINSDIVVKVITSTEGHVKIGVEAPADVQILRGEISNMFNINVSHTLSETKQLRKTIKPFHSLKDKLNLYFNKKNYINDLIKSSDARFKKLFYKNPIPIIITRFDDGTIVEVNDRFCEIINLDKNFIIGNTTIDLKIYPDKNFRINMLNSISQKRGLKNFELKFINHSGEQLDTIVTYEILEFDGIKYLIDMFLDITDMKKIQEQIQLESEMLDSIGQAVIAIDLLHNIIYWNQAAEKLYQWSRSEVLGKNIAAVAPTNSALITNEDVKKALDRGGTWSGEFLIKRKDGSLLPALINFKSIHNLSGIVTGIISISTEISELKNKELELREAISNAEEMNMLKSHFLTNISHELRTPLTGILGFSEILAGEIFHPPHFKIIKDIESSGKRLLNTINSILELSSLEAGRYDINFSFLTVNKLLEEEVELFYPSAYLKNISLNLNLPKDDIVIKSDERILKNIISNLINNAIKFTNRGSVNIDLEMYQNNFIKIIVRDTGIGINEENKKIIFDAFRQVSEGYSRIFEGTGLGLTIVNKFLKLINGEISFESKVGVGSEFTIILPVSEIKPSTIKISNTDDSKNDAIRQNLSNIPKILIVEDEILNASVIKLMLQNKFYIEVAKNGEKALELLKNKDYDLFLMDINLGEGINGIILTKIIRKISKYTKTPIIAITAYAMRGDENECISAGCNDYIVKPFGREILLKKISKFLSN
ncbi:MAG: PAS domain S-box protein [Ignavibacteriaceae bacterium]